MASATLFLQCYFLLLWSLCEASGSLCYSHKQIITTGDQPCNPSQAESWCCGWGWACLENRVCSATLHITPYPANRRPGRGGCTDSSWNSSQCANFCRDDLGMFLGSLQNSLAKLIPSLTMVLETTGATMVQCSDHTYCCAIDKNCDCQTGVGTISFEAAPIPFTTIGFPLSEATIL